MRCNVYAAALALASTIVQTENAPVVIETVTILRSWESRPIVDRGCFCIVEGSGQGKGTRLHHNGNPRANTLGTRRYFERALN